MQAFRNQKTFLYFQDPSFGVMRRGQTAIKARRAATAEAKRLNGVRRMHERMIASRDPMGTQGFAGLHQGAKMRDTRGTARMWTFITLAALGIWTGALIGMIIPYACGLAQTSCTISLPF